MNYITYKILHIKHDPYRISGYEYDGNHKAIWWREAKWAPWYDSATQYHVLPVEWTLC